MRLELLDKSIYEGENDSRELVVSVDEGLSDYEIRLAFLTPAGCRCMTNELALENLKARYMLPSVLLDAPGRLLAQIVAENDEQHIVKSEVYSFFVEKSVNASGEINVEGEFISLPGVNEKVDRLYRELENYALLTDLPSKTSELTNDAGFLTEHQDISGKADIEDIPTKLSELQNDAGYLTRHQDISGKADKPELIRTTEDQSDPGRLEGTISKAPEEGTQVLVITPGSETTPTSLYLLWQSQMAVTNTPIYSSGGTVQDKAYAAYSILRLTYHRDLDIGGTYYTGWWLDAEPKTSGFSGDYNDLTNKPTIPTVPTNVSSFVNDAGYITAADVSAEAPTLLRTNKSDTYEGMLNGRTVLPALDEGTQIIVVTPGVETVPQTLASAYYTGTASVATNESYIFGHGNQPQTKAYPPYSMLRLTYHKNLDINGTQWTGWWLDAELTGDEISANEVETAWISVMNAGNGE